MKKKIAICTGLIIIMLSIFIFNFEKIQYSTTVSAFEEITVEDLSDMQSSEESVYIYIGRKTCPFCREFVPKLRSVAMNKNVKIHYINSENSGNSMLKDFREMNEIKTVPALLNVKGNHVDLVMDSTLTEDQISKFLNQDE